MAYNVIDISKFQGDIDFARVKADNIDGIVIRAGYRGYLAAGTIVADPYAVAYINACIAEGIPYGVYFFTQAVNATEGAEEATWTLNFLKTNGFAAQPLLPVYIDTEGSTAPNSTGRADGISVAARTAAVKAFCQTIENAGYYAGIYASTSWFNSKLVDSELVNYTHWVAHYGVSAPTYKGKYDMWQYTSGGTVDGIPSSGTPGRVDMNYAYVDFPAITRANGLNGYDADGSITPTPPSEDDDPKYVQPYPCYLKIGYASGGDLNTLKNLLDSLLITYTVDSGYIITDIKVSVGDQVTIKNKCKELGIPIVEYTPEDVEPEPEPDPIVDPTESWVTKIIKFLMDLFKCVYNEDNASEENTK